MDNAVKRRLSFLCKDREEKSENKPYNDKGVYPEKKDVFGGSRLAGGHRL